MQKPVSLSHETYFVARGPPVCLQGGQQLHTRDRASVWGPSRDLRVGRMCIEVT